MSIAGFLRVAALLVAPAVLLGGCRDTGSAPDEAIPASDARILFSGQNLDGVRAVALLQGDSLLAMVSRFEPFVHVVDTAGNPVSSFGRRGGGPDEYRFPFMVVPSDQPGTVGVYDPGYRRVVYTTLDGRTTGRDSIPKLSEGFVIAAFEEFSYGSPFGLARLGDSWVTGQTSGQLAATEGLRTLAIARLTNGGADTLVSFADDPRYPRVDATQMRPYVSIPLWAGCNASSIAVYDPAADSVRWLDATGGQAASAQVKLNRVPMGDDHMARYLRLRIESNARESGAPLEVEDLVQQMLPSSRAMFPDSTPPAVAMLCDRDERAWLRLFDEQHPLGYGALWAVADAGRGHIATVRFPERFTPLLVRDGRAWGVIHSELDEQSLAVVELPALRD